ncbi:MAG: hypothetical protein P1U50_14070 [Parvibaculaceae bacterium]|nr:hypothetical protein [Parvibaculaceae bacterium]
MWMIKKAVSLFSLLPSSLLPYVLCITLGMSVGGYSVHKLYALEELSALRAQARNADVNRAARIASAAQAAQTALKAVTRLNTAKKGIISHVPHTSACRLNADTVRVLNQLRGAL